MVQKEVVEAAASKQTRVQEKKAVEARSIRVQADKLDQLIDLVGELVHRRRVRQPAGTAQRASAIWWSQLPSSPAWSKTFAISALQLRMVQIGETFTRFNRVVRDVSKELGKEIDLVISGAETELDKSVVEKIGDPLMRLSAQQHGSRH